MPINVSFNMTEPGNYQPVVAYMLATHRATITARLHTGLAETIKQQLQFTFAAVSHFDTAAHLAISPHRTRSAQTRQNAALLHTVVSRDLGAITHVRVLSIHTPIYFDTELAKWRHLDDSSQLEVTVKFSTRPLAENYRPNRGTDIDDDLVTFVIDPEGTIQDIKKANLYQLALYSGTAAAERARIDEQSDCLQAIGIHAHYSTHHLLIDAYHHINEKRLRAAFTNLRLCLSRPEITDNDYYRSCLALIEHYHTTFATDLRYNPYLRDELISTAKFFKLWHKKSGKLQVFFNNHHEQPVSDSAASRVRFRATYSAIINILSLSKLALDLLKQHVRLIPLFSAEHAQLLLRLLQPHDCFKPLINIEVNWKEDEHRLLFQLSAKLTPSPTLPELDDDSPSKRRRGGKGQHVSSDKTGGAATASDITPDRPSRPTRTSRSPHTPTTAHKARTRPLSVVIPGRATPDPSGVIGTYHGAGALFSPQRGALADRLEATALDSPPPASRTRRTSRGGSSSAAQRRLIAMLAEAETTGSGEEADDEFSPGSVHTRRAGGSGPPRQ